MIAEHAAVALATAAGGWPVFPCRADKRPATAHGWQDATLDPARIEAWWCRHPDHLVGTPTEGLAVVDLDEHHPANEGASWRWWYETATAHGWSPLDTPMVVTPSGGVHVYFAAPDGRTVRNSAGKLAVGVDVRGDGGYAIAPGSVLPDGRRYELLEPHPTELPEAPGWLLDLIDAARATPPLTTAVPRLDDPRGTRYGRQALEAELGRLAIAPQGARNDTLVRAAYRTGQLVAGGQLYAQDAAGQLHAVAARIGLADAEIAATIRSGMTSGAQYPRRPAA